MFEIIIAAICIFVGNIIGTTAQSRGIGGEGMREILFRGKRLDNGEWIQGDLEQFPAHGVVRIVKQEQPYKDAEVDLDTVGQYTGFHAIRVDGANVELITSQGFIFNQSLIGKTVFLTREEAERALKERET